PSGRVVRYVHNASDPTSLVFPGVFSIYQDRAGVMYTGGATGGVCIFDQSRQQFGYQYTGGVNVGGFYEDPDGTLWAGTEIGGLQKYDRKAQRVTIWTTLHGAAEKEVVKLDKGSFIWALHRDRHGTLWM